MLKHLKIENLAIIEDLSLSFNENMTALTGQTGAGKSLLIDSLKLLFGARADQDLIRYGANEAMVTGVFSGSSQSLRHLLQTLNIDASEIKISRTISRTNKNNIQINNQVITLQELKKVAYFLGDIHEQHDITKLLDPKLQLSLIDQISMVEIEPLYNQYQLAKQQYLDSKSIYEQALKQEKDKKLELEDLKDQQEELSKAKLITDEKNDLIERINKLSHQEKIVTNVNKAYELLDNIYQEGTIFEASDALDLVLKYDNLYKQSSETLKEVHYVLEGIRSDLKKSLHLFDYYSDQELDTLQSRLQFLTELEKKYKKDIDTLMAYLNELDDKIMMVEDYDAYIKKLKTKMDKDHELVIQKGLNLRKTRVKLAKVLEKEIINELEQLDLEKVQFEIMFEANPQNQLYEDGLDVVTFNISLNKGEPLKPLYKTASGGELSRFMLALKIVFAKYQDLNLVVFDEIDMGISGKTASKVAIRIKQLSNNIQVLSITHLPQVAAIANHHYHIEKYIKDQRTLTNVRHLNVDERVSILAEMLSGERIDQYAINHAKALLEQ